jgi:hypothetical protein
MLETSEQLRQQADAALRDLAAAEDERTRDERLDGPQRLGG